MENQTKFVLKFQGRNDGDSPAKASSQNFFQRIEILRTIYYENISPNNFVLQMVLFI